jgi:hypothetical protein
LEEDHEARQELGHAMNMTPNDPRTEASTCKSLGTQPENSEACIARIQAITVKETTPNAHMQVHTNKESCKKQPGRKPGPNQAEMGLGGKGQILWDVTVDIGYVQPMDFLAPGSRDRFDANNKAVDYLFRALCQPEFDRVHTEHLACKI